MDSQNVQLVPSQDITLLSGGRNHKEKIQPWKGVRPKAPSAGEETVRHEFKEGDMILDFGHRGCSYPSNFKGY